MKELPTGHRLLGHGLLLLLALPYLLPLVWMVSTSLKGEAQIFPRAGSSLSPVSLGNLIPGPVRWENYPEALRSVPLATYIKNTLVLCACNVTGTVLSSAVVAYGFARLRFRGREGLFALLLATMALPGQVTMIPTFALFSALGWYGTFLPLVVPSFFGSAFFIFLMRQFFLTLPEEMAEAARLEGAGEWDIFWRIVLPLSRPVLATCALFQFLGTWNDFFGPLLYLNDPARYTLAYGLQQFMSSYGGKWAQLMAAATLFTAPVILLFFVAQKTFIQGIATTGSKG
ncbi:MAG: carbohydrate ABC transporter permease [Candidatus Latescibacteria bacterium]|nr:carbohydrate ABC transporter permease [Candidatus Latescibacterota bacterium]